MNFIISKIIPKPTIDTKSIPKEIKNKITKLRNPSSADLE